MRVCDGVCTHLLPHAHFTATVWRTGHLDTLLTRVHTHARLKDVKKVCAVRKSRLSISPSPFWCFTHVLHCFLVTSLTPRVSLSYSRNSCRVYPDPKGRVRCTSETVRMTLATWPTCRTPEVMSPTCLTRWFLRMMTRRPWTIQTTTVSVTSQKQHTRTLDDSVFLQCESPYPAEHSQEWRPQSTQEERVWKQGRESIGEGLCKQKQENESSHWQAIGNKGRVVAKTKMKELLVPRGPQCIIVWGKFTSTYRRSWTLRIHQPKSWARQRRTYWCEDYSCHLQRKQLFILDKKIFECNRMFMNVYVEEIKYLLSIVQKMVLQSYDETLNVEVIDSNDPYLSGQQQKSTCSQIPSYVFGKFLNQQKRWRDGKDSWWKFRQQFLNNFTESMESHLSASGILSQDWHHWNCIESVRKT